MLESTLTSKGQTTLPKAVREALGLKSGDRLRYFISGDTVRLVRPKSLIEMSGCLAGRYAGPPVSIEEMDEGVARHLAEKHAPSRQAAE